jgi:hypothetical protein
MPKRKFRTNNSATQVAIEKEVAVAVIGIYSAFADGEDLGNAEEYALNEMLSSISQFGEYSDEDFHELRDQAWDFIESEGTDNALGMAIASLPSEDYQEVAYITALTIIAIDGELPEEEEEYITSLQEALNISDERAQEIIDELFGDKDEEEEEEEVE